MIIFITRKYPPSIGGMEKLSYSLTTEISRRRSVRVISWGGAQTLLPLFFVRAFVQACKILLTQTVDLVHLGDPVLAPLGLLLKILFAVPIVVTVHGLDITYPNRLYQWVVPRTVSLFDAVIPISAQAYRECLVRGIPAERCQTIPVGVNSIPPFRFTQEGARKYLLSRLGLDLASRRVLLTSGRLIARKGVAHFIENTLPLIVAKQPQTVYLIIGDGPDRDRILGKAREHHLADHVSLLGLVDQETLWAAYYAADVFVMPNVPVKGDVEGFGLVILEACLAECCVVASDLEGIRDAVENGRNGLLVPALNPFRQAEIILRLLECPEEREALGRQGRQVVAERFDWSRIAGRYLSVFDSVVARDTARRYG